MKKRSLKFKLIVGGILAVIIPLTVVGLFSVNKASNALIDAAEGQAEKIAKDLAVMTQSVIEQEVKLTREMAMNPLVTRAADRVAREGMDAAMTDLLALDVHLKTVYSQIGSDYDTMFLTDARGNAVSDHSGGAMRTGKVSLAERDYFMGARKTGRVYIGEAVLSKNTGKPIIVIGVPLNNNAGEFAGVFGLAMKLDGLSEKITGIKIGDTGYPFVIDAEGLVVAHPNKAYILEMNLARLEGMESITTRMMNQESGVDHYRFKGVDKIAGFAPVPLTRWSIGVTQNESEFMAPATAIRNVVLIAGAVFLVIALLGVLWFARGLTLPINRIIAGLNEGAAQVAEASTQVSDTSQSLAEGSSEQAASIEETSSSMEEMSSMTRKNAENSRHADTLMKEANTVVKEANASMDQLTVSMKEISKASEETSKIIKTIDEIAFQTNLLALNAAVEAARAGEAGAGFAVVADEVRNLAMRAAEAAKNTAELIEGTVKKVSEGSDLVFRTNDAFVKVADSAGKVGELVAEISEASNEQSNGIEQVNIAIVEMDKVVQQNAANAEESASAAEEMNAQAQQLNAYVQDLVEIITGRKDSQAGTDRRSGRSRHTGRQGSRPASAGSAAGPGKRLLSASAGKNPSQVIPLDDDDDFESF